MYSFLHTFNFEMRTVTDSGADMKTPAVAVAVLVSDLFPLSSVLLSRVNIGSLPTVLQYWAQKIQSDTLCNKLKFALLNMIHFEEV